MYVFKCMSNSQSDVFLYMCIRTCTIYAGMHGIGRNLSCAVSDWGLGAAHSLRSCYSYLCIIHMVSSVRNGPIWVWARIQNWSCYLTKYHAVQSQLPPYPPPPTGNHYIYTERVRELSCGLENNSKCDCLQLFLYSWVVVSTLILCKVLEEPHHVYE